MDKCVLKHRVKTYECDQFDNMKADYLMKYMQESATHQMSMEGLPYDELLKKGMALLINRMDIEFYEPIKKFDDIELRSWPCEGKGATLPRRYSVSKGDTPIAFALGQWSLVDTKNMKIMKANSVDFGCYTMGDLEGLSCEKYKVPPQEEMELLDSFTIRYNDVDCNGHLNNTNYLRMVQDYIPELNEGARMESAKIHFSKEAILGSTVELYGKMAIEEGRKVYYFKSLINRNEEVQTNCTIKIVLE